MSRLEDTLRRDLHQIADRATPSPDAWASIRQRIADQEPILETEVIMLTENTIRTRRWPLVAAAAAIVALIIGVIAVVNRDDGTTVPADELPAPPTVVPTPETETLPGNGAALPTGRFTADQLGTPVTFTVPADGSPFRVEINNAVAFSIKNADGWVGFERIGSFYDATQALDPDVTGLGSIPPDDVDAWIEANGVVVEASRDVSVGGRPAKFRQVRLPDGSGPIQLSTLSADLIDAYPRSAFALTSIHGANAYWYVQLDDYEPLGIAAYSYRDDLQSWLDEIAPLIESIELGDPAPAVPGGTARLSTFASSAPAVALPAQGEALPAGRYTTDQFGTPVTFTVPADAAAFQVDLVNPVALAIKNDNGWVGFERIGSFYDATQARDPEVTGLGNIPPDDIDAWIEANGVVVEASRDVTVGGRPAKFRQVRLPDGVVRLNLNTISADQLDVNGGFGSELRSIYANAYWYVQLDDYEPLGIWAYAYGPDLQSWLDELAPLIESIVLGDPAPAVPGGTARLSTFPAGAVGPPTT